MPQGMEAGRSPDEVAAEIEQRVEALRASAARIAAGSELDEHVAAIDHLAEYAALLRSATAQAAGASALDVAAGRYLLKLELPDGRWQLVETELGAPPHRGTLIDVAAGRWQVSRTETVETKPAGKPRREYYVCAPAA